MAEFINKSFGGLDRKYYLRQIVFGCGIAAAVFSFQTATRPPSAGLIAWLGLNTLLYPYARFVWEGIVDFLVGQNVFFVPALLLLGMKIITMLMCWTMSIVIAPLGLAWLYWHHSRAASPGEN